jgi:hypothetical protein
MVIRSLPFGCISFVPFLYQFNVCSNLYVRTIFCLSTELVSGMLVALLTLHFNLVLHYL